MSVLCLLCQNVITPFLLFLSYLEFFIIQPIVILREPYIVDRLIHLSFFYCVLMSIKVIFKMYKIQNVVFPLLFFLLLLFNPASYRSISPIWTRSPSRCLPVKRAFSFATVGCLGFRLWICVICMDQILIVTGNIIIRLKEISLNCTDTGVLKNV